AIFTEAIPPRPAKRARPLLPPGAEVLDRFHDVPATAIDISRHHLGLESEHLLVVGRDPGAQRGAHGPALPGQKTPPDHDDQTPCFTVPTLPHEEVAVSIRYFWRIRRNVTTVTPAMAIISNVLGSGTAAVTPASLTLSRPGVSINPVEYS